MELLKIEGSPLGTDAGLHGQRDGSAFYKLKELLYLKTAVVCHVEKFTSVLVDGNKLESHKIFAILVILRIT